MQLCNYYAILNSRHKVEDYMSLSTVWYHHFKFLNNFIKIPKCDYLRFIESVEKLVKFAILLQDAQEGGSAALVSGQS